MNRLLQHYIAFPFSMTNYLFDVETQSFHFQFQADQKVLLELIEEYLPDISAKFKKEDIGITGTTFSILRLLRSF